MKIRADIKKLERKKDEVYSDLQQKYSEYMKSLTPSQHGIYITDHAIVRYLERVKGFKFDNSLSDTEKIATFPFKPEDIRAEMLSIQEDRTILRSQKRVYIRSNYKYVIRELSITTVILN